MLTALQSINQATGRVRFTGNKASELKIMSQSSYSRKKRNPKLFTIDELIKIDKEVHFTNEEILALFNKKINVGGK